MRLTCVTLLLLAGCAQQVTQKADKQEVTDARHRARVHTELAAEYYSRAQYAVALEELSDALQADARYVPAYNMLGLVYMELKDDRRASESFQNALKLAPGDPGLNNNYGWYLCNRQREAESVNYFLIALKDPLYSTPQKSLVNAGICSRRANNDTAAADYFRRALQLQADEPQANYHLADINYRLGNYVEAKRHLARVMQLPNATAEALWLGVRAERKLGDKDTEASYALKLRSRYPESKEARALQRGQYE